MEPRSGVVAFRLRRLPETEWLLRCDDAGKLRVHRGTGARHRGAHPARCLTRRCGTAKEEEGAPQEELRLEQRFRRRCRKVKSPWFPTRVRPDVSSLGS